jgi:uncharacterized membrane protein
MVSRLEDLAPPRESRSAKLEVVRSGAPSAQAAREAAVEESLEGIREALLGIEAELAEMSGRARMIAREEAELAGSKVIDEARLAARREAKASIEAAAEEEATMPSPFSWTMVLVALCVSALIGLSATLSGWAGVVAVAMAILVWSTVAVARG